jgi:uncharacterized protein (TIGR03435 family)
MRRPDRTEDGIVRKGSFGAGTFVLCASIFGQAAPEVKSFDVASIRLHTDPPGSAAVRVENDSRFDARPILLSTLLIRAYNLRPYQVVGPSWITEQHYDVVATLPQGATKEDIPAVLQELLADRFHILVHRELREADVR